MDEIITQFQTTVFNPDNEQNKTNFDIMYKNWGRLGQQDQRRKDILEAQRSNRNANLDLTRGIMDLVNSIEQQDLFQYRKVQATYRPSIYVAGFTQTSSTYRNVLMMSEWMVEKPVDFHDNWLVVPCPKGVRTLVVACRGNTKCYTKFGIFRLACHTALPGGNPYDPRNKNSCVVLDCFHVESLNTLYILDLLAWKAQPMTDGEAEFRHFWLKSHIEDIPELTTINAINKILFKVIPKVRCDPIAFDKFMEKYPHFENHVPSLDGLLFYHKMGHYVSGVTPLVGWLYPFMVPEVLGIDPATINPVYFLERPLNYINQAQFIREFDKRVSSKAPGFVKHAVSMDTSAEGAVSKQTLGKRRHRKPHHRSNDAAMFEFNQTAAMPTSSYMPQNIAPMPHNVPRFPIARPVGTGKPVASTSFMPTTDQWQTWWF